MAVNEVRLHTINFEIYDSGNRMLGVASIDLPEINFQTVDVKGAGILGEYSSPVLGHTESLELTLHWRVLNNDSLKYLRQRDAFNFSARGANQGYEASTGELVVNAIRIDARGLIKSFKAGKLEPAEQSETEMTLEVDYLAIKYNGKSCMEFDKFNYIYNVNEIDYLPNLREALGLD